MKIQTAIYGHYFNFLGYEVDEDDTFVLMGIMGELTGKKAEQIDGGNGWRHGLDHKFLIAPNLEVLNAPGNLKQYVKRLAGKEPMYLAGRLYKPSDEILSGFFESYSFPVILLYNGRSEDDFRRRFSGVEALVQPNADEMKNKDAAILDEKMLEKSEIIIP